jgi:hypothetical protein
MGLDGWDGKAGRNVLTPESEGRDGDSRAPLAAGLQNLLLLAEFGGVSGVDYSPEAITRLLPVVDSVGKVKTHQAKADAFGPGHGSAPGLVRQCSVVD